MAYCRQVFLYSCACLLTSYLSGQPLADSLIFQSTFEEEAFADFAEGLSDHSLALRLLLASDGDVQEADLQKAQTKINGMSAYMASNYKAGKYKPYAKKLFAHVHDHALQKYEENVSFMETLEEGRYNCLTASALFALIAAQNGVPFEIREQPTHIFFVIDPDKERIALESTNPVSGVYKFDLDAYVKMLVNMKFVSAEEVRGRDTREVYDSYFDGHEKAISLIEVAGDLYHNTSLTYAEAEDFEKALELINKALVLNDSDRSFLLKNYYLHWLSTELELDEAVTKGYVQACLHYEKHPESTPDYLVSRHDDYASKMLIAKDSEAEYLDTYHMLLQAFDHERLGEQQKELKLSHHLRMGEAQELKHNFSLVLSHLDSAIQIQPDNIRLQALAANICARELSTMTNTPLQMMEKHAAYAEQYPFLPGTEPMRLMHAVATSLLAANDFRNDDLKAGISKQQEYIQQLESLDNTPYLQDMTGHLYGQVSAYYMRQRNDGAAKKWLQDGLQLAPESQELRRRMENYEEYERRYKR